MIRLRVANRWLALLALLVLLVGSTATEAASVAGRIQYYTNRSDVAGATVGAQGSAVSTDAAGRYTFASLADGNWQVTPQKQGDAAGAVNAVDAMYALQAAVGIRALSERQLLACDVNGDGVVSASDALLMLRYAVGIADHMPVGLRCGSDWAFAPEPAVITGQRLTAPHPGRDTCAPGAIVYEPLASAAVNQDFAAILFGDCNGSWQGAQPTPQPTAGPPAALDVHVLSTYPHDPQSFTQGLLLHGGKLYESAGRYGLSSLREVDPTTGRVLRSVPLASNYFGEGLALIDERLVQLTWMEHVALEYDRTTFAPLGQFAYTTQGWGICYDGSRLIMSDGSDTLFFRDPTNFTVTGQIGVTLNGQPRASLNELECVGNDVYANIWLTDTIVRIDPRTGVVTATINASGLLTAGERASADVLNGIAYDAGRGTFLITGKLWPKLFEVQFVAHTP